MSKVIIKLSTQGIYFNFIEVDEKEISDSIIRNNVGESDGESWIEGLHGCFDEFPDLVILCDENAALKNLPPICVNRNYGLVRGDVLIVEKRTDEDGDINIYGMEIETAVKMLIYMANHQFT